jgi:hypothetical protein
MTLAPPHPDDRRITWRIDWEGKTYAWEDVTVAHLAIVALLSGHDEWESLSPYAVDPGTGYLMAAYLLCAFLAVERAEAAGIDPNSPDDEAADLFAQVLVEVRAIRAVDLADAVRFL